MLSDAPRSRIPDKNFNKLVLRFHVSCHEQTAGNLSFHAHEVSLSLGIMRINYDCAWKRTKEYLYLHVFVFN